MSQTLDFGILARGINEQEIKLSPYGIFNSSRTDR